MKVVVLRLSLIVVGQRASRLIEALSKAPALFLLMIDPLLRELEASGVGLSLKGYYAVGFLYANDVRSQATSEDSLKKLIDMVKSFADRNLLKLNVSKCDFEELLCG